MNFDNLTGHDYYFDENGLPLDFTFKQKTIYVKGFKVILNKLPYFKSSVTGKIYFTTPAVFIIEALIEKAKVEGKSEIKINEFGKFNRLKASISGSTKFKYSFSEHFFIPSLMTNLPTDGFFTPVYFGRNVLVKFKHGDGYELINHTKSFGNLSKVGDYNIPFGINPNGCIIMWLGDLVSLSGNELLYLYSENIESQYNIHSDYYESQIQRVHQLRSDT